MNSVRRNGDQNHGFPRPPFTQQHDQITHPLPTPTSAATGFPILAIAILGILSTAFLLACYYIFVIKCCLNWHRCNFLRRFSSTGTLQREDPFIVYATELENRGLDESVIQAIPIFQFKTGEGKNNEEKKNTHECAVCLTDFQEEERLRLLPNCLHAFHIDCIDTWLQSNANCPLCRSIITNPYRFSIDQIMEQNPYRDSHRFSDNPAGDRDSIVIEVSEDGSDQTRSGNSMVEISSQGSHCNPSPRKLEQRILRKKSRKLHHVSSMGDECIDVRSKDEQFSIQPIRRSFSMDSSADRQLYLSVQEILQQNPQLQELSNGEGSSSSRSRRSIFSFGHSRGSRSAVLPI